MFKVLTLNQISVRGLDRLPRDSYEVGSEIGDPDAILVRSQKLTADNITPHLRAIGRAGAGVNNIPVDAMTEHGVVVFNTPGANANAVKELVLTGLLLASRGIVGGIDFVGSLDRNLGHAEMSKIVEGEKKRFKGNELYGRTLGVVGLGAIGSMVARMGLQLGMDVLGYDPALSVEAAWRLPSEVQSMENLESLLARSDYVTLHVPALEETRHMINAAALRNVREGAVLLNFARDEIVEVPAVVEALDAGRLRSYVADFPEPELVGRDDVILTPHLGASTAEAEENCAVMAADQLRDFLENGNIRNSVNFPLVILERSEGYRLAVTNRNEPGLLGNMLSIFADRNINIIDMINKSRDNVAYNLLDVDVEPDDSLLQVLCEVPGVINVRTF